MAEIGDIQYRMECPLCGRKFLVNTVTSKMSKHPPKGEVAEPYVPYVPCPGSGMTGLVIDTKIKGFD